MRFRAQLDAMPGGQAIIASLQDVWAVLDTWRGHDKRGTGSPEGVVPGSVGDTWRRTDGSTSTSFYVKESGNNTKTGWSPK